MPVYEYACPDCGFQFEKLQKFSDKPIRVCPSCKKRNVHKVMPRIAVAFKGSGFYVNDSKGSSASTSVSKPAEEPAKPAETKTETTPAADAKPEAKPEAKPKETKKKKAKAE